MAFKSPLDDIPQFLKDHPYWAAWSTPHKLLSDAKRRPLDLRRALAPASVTANSPSGFRANFLSTWAPWANARAHLEKIAPAIPYKTPVPVGVGILIHTTNNTGASGQLSNPHRLAFIDLDDLLDEDGNAPTWATDFIQRARALGGYIERSAGGGGAHIFLRVPTEMRLRRNRYTRIHPSGEPVGIEIYVDQRFAALTGIPIGQHEHPDEMNDPTAGALLVREFIDDMEEHAAPVLTGELPPAPKSLPKPSPAVIRAASASITPLLKATFDDPAAAFEAWGKHRRLSSQDLSLSAWRFATFLEAARACPAAPEPLYELFNPSEEPLHPNIEEWREFSGHNKKPHRKYADIQRAHALVNQEMKVLLETEEDAALREMEAILNPPAPLEPEIVRPEDPQPAKRENRAMRPDTSLILKKRPTGLEEDPITTENPSWAELGLVMRVGKNGAYPLNTSVNIIRCISRHPFFKDDKIERNILTGTTMLNRKPLEDTVITRWKEPVRSILNSDGDPSTEAMRDAIEVIAEDNAYDPLVEHLAMLPSWAPPADAAYNPEESLLSNWLERVGAKPSHDLRRYSRRIILGLIARALNSGVKFDYVPVFEGRQGLGKSTLVKALVGEEFYCTIIGGLQNKDARITLRGKWGVEISELASFKKTDNESLKEFFAADKDSYRAPYERANRDYKRRTLLFGTTNERQYLNDPTGARRYWPVYFHKEMNIRWFLEHRSQIFAEALYFYRQGEAFHDTMEELESPERQAQLSTRLATPAWQMRIIEHLQSLPTPHPPEGAESLGFSGVLQTSYVAGLQKSLDLPQSVMHLGAPMLASLLKRAGFVRREFSYRPRGESKVPAKLSCWIHPALTELTTEQLHAFLSLFPELFPGGAQPASWIMLQELYLESAVQALKSARGFDIIQFSEEG